MLFETDFFFLKSSSCFSCIRASYTSQPHTIWDLYALYSICIPLYDATIHTRIYMNVNAGLYYSRKSTRFLWVLKWNNFIWTFLCHGIPWLLDDADYMTACGTSKGKNDSRSFTSQWNERCAISFFFNTPQALYKRTLFIHWIIHNKCIKPILIHFSLHIEFPLGRPFPILFARCVRVWKCMKPFGIYGAGRVFLYC